MTRVYVGSEALAAGRVNRYQLANTHQRVFPDVYAPRGALTLLDRTTAAWLWSGRQATVTGRAAAALHGARWVDPDIPIELNFANNRSPCGVVTRRETLLASELTRDVERQDFLLSIGWIVVRVLADHRRTHVIGRVQRAWNARSRWAAC